MSIKICILLRLKVLKIFSHEAKALTVAHSKNMNNGNRQICPCVEYARSVEREIDYAQVLGIEGWMLHACKFCGMKPRHWLVHKATTYLHWYPLHFSGTKNSSSLEREGNGLDHVFGIEGGVFQSCRCCGMKPRQLTDTMVVAFYPTLTNLSCTCKVSASHHSILLVGLENAYWCFREVLSCGMHVSGYTVGSVY